MVLNDTFRPDRLRPTNYRVRAHRLFFCLFLLLPAFFTIAYAQTLRADYQFRGDLNSSVPGAPALTDLIGSGGANSFQVDLVDGYSRQSLRFPFNSGVAVNTSGVIPNNEYTVVMLFRFDSLSGYRRVADFTNGQSDECGAYIFDSRFDLEAITSSILFPDLYVQAVIVREASGEVRAYRDGYLKVGLLNDNGCFQISNDLIRFFQDDIEPPPEASAGNVARIRLYDGPMRTDQVEALDRVPDATGGGEQRLLFVSGRDGNAEIYTMNTDGSNQLRLTNTPSGGTQSSIDYEPSWSPSGQKIAFTSYRSGNYGIYTMNRDGSDPTLFVDTQHFEYYPHFSPDGNHILFSRCPIGDRCDIWVKDVNGGGNETRLTTALEHDEYGSWSPDGTRIVFSSARDTGAAYDIYSMAANGTDIIRLTNTAAGENTPHWSPNGSKIVFSSRSGGSSEIYSMNADGSNQINLTNNPFNDVEPRWSPDGTKIAFSSDRATKIGTSTAYDEVFVMNADGSSPIRITFNNHIDSMSGWLGDGTPTPTSTATPTNTPTATPTNTQTATPTPSATPTPTGTTLFDYDGDRRSDISVFRPAAGEWYLERSTAGTFGISFGIGTDRIGPADYDGDGKTDIAVYRASTSVWYILNSSDGTFNYYVFGVDDDRPTPADYDGDGKADISVFRPSTGIWYLIFSSDGSFAGVHFGANGDRPTIGDFDADGKADIAVFRPSTSVWYQLNSSDGSFYGEQFGVSTDRVTPADFDGDGKTDIAIYRPSESLWYIKNSATATYAPYVLGIAEDIPVAADFDGDGKADIAVFRPSNGTWYIVNSSTGGFTIYQFGTNGDLPTQSAFGN